MIKIFWQAINLKIEGADFFTSRVQKELRVVSKIKQPMIIAFFHFSAVVRIEPAETCVP